MTSPGGAGIGALLPFERNGLKTLLINIVEVVAKVLGELGSDDKG